jgi:hypothetical protein
MIISSIEKILFKINQKRLALAQRRVFIEKVEKLLQTECIVPDALQYVWQVDSVSHTIPACGIIIFGCEVDPEDIDWHRDYVSGFQYPLKRIDCLKISKWFDRGIDIKFPWELSRFQFAVNWATVYKSEENREHYLSFRKLVMDWLAHNPFLYGVNWLCTMEVALRSVSWIVALNFFQKEFEKDGEFKSVLIRSLVQHAEYIHAFPEIYENGHTTNHTTADYVGLLFLALTLREHPQAGLWREQAVQGLIGCMEYQVYEDGVSFEGSTSYHRFVLELFAYSAVLCRANQIDLPNQYYGKLFRMFEFSAACMDHKGHVPLVGDDDSGRVLVFQEQPNADHAYLLSLGEHIFEYPFPSQCIRKESFDNLMPLISKLAIASLPVEFRNTAQSIHFPNGGMYFLKNNRFSILVPAIPLGQKGRGGHNHLDQGSLAISVDGQPIICDPGTFTYTRNKAQRNLFRSYDHHSTISNTHDEKLSLLKTGYWSLPKYFSSEVLLALSDHLLLKVDNLVYKQTRTRNVSLQKGILEIVDKLTGPFKVRMIFHPNVIITHTVQDRITTNIFNVALLDYCQYEISEISISPFYDGIIKTNCLIIKSADQCKFQIVL